MGGVFRARNRRESLEVAAFLPTFATMKYRVVP